MVTMPDRPLGGVVDMPPLRGFTTPDMLLDDALELLTPPRRMTVTDAAEAYCRVPIAGSWGQFDRGVTPYFVEPADMTQSRLYNEIAIVGPVQSGKTQLLASVCVHTVTCDPAPVLIVMPRRADRDAWVEDKFDPMIRNSPPVYDRLRKGRDDSTFSRKRFRGMNVNIVYPTPTSLSSRSMRLVLVTEVDHIADGIGRGGEVEASLRGMVQARITTFGSKGCVVMESTIAHSQMDPDWRQIAEQPHAFPPVAGGIVPIYNSGTRGRWYWECPDCGEEFEPRFDRLEFDDALDPAEAGTGAVMVCPHNGCILEHRHKAELNRAALRGRGGWRHEGRDGRLVAMGDAEIRQTGTASYALNGAAAAFSTWARLVAGFLEARAKFDESGDDTGLREHAFLSVGLPFKPLRRDDDGLSLGFLLDHRVEAPRGICPSWARFVTVSVDVQGAYFAVMVTAWGAKGERIVVDRYDIGQPPPGAPGDPQRGLDPALYAEDWQVLEPLFSQVWPVAGARYGLRAAAVCVDFQGAAGVSDKAEAFWRLRKRAGDGGRFYLTRGRGGFHHRGRCWLDRPEGGSKGAKARSIVLLNMATDRLKDTIAAALMRGASGTGALHLPTWMDTPLVAEFAAEERLESGWEKRKGVRRNEGFDLAVQAQAMAEIKGALRVDWTGRPPGWAALGPENDNAVPMPDGQAPETGAGPGVPVPDKAGAEVMVPPRPARRRSKSGTLNFLKR